MKKRCLWCPVRFDPDPRLKDRQKSCGGENCKRKQNLLGQKRWKKKNEKACIESRKDWRDDHPDFWKDYRRKNPEYAERNRIQSRIRKRFSRLGLQKKLDILEVTEKTMKYWNLPLFAKRPRSLCPLLFAYEGGDERAQGHQKSRVP